MTSYTFQREELLALFNQVGVSAAQGMADDFLTPLADGETAIGRDFSSEELALAKLMAHPHSVVRVMRRDADQETLADAYYFVAGEHFAVLTAADAGYALSALDSLEATMNDASSMLPLRPDSDTVNIRIMLDMDDFIDARALARDWHSVSTETILEAEGLETFEAIDLADSVGNQEWNGWLSFLFFKDGKLTRERTMWALQGSDSSWLGYLDLDTGKMVVQAANNEVLSDISLRIWEALDES